MMAKVDPNRTNSTERDPCPFEPYTSTEKAFQCIAYFIIMFGSFIGNVLVICVVILNRQMRTVTNYLIVNMAVANLFVTTFTMPVTVKALATGRGINWSNGVLYDLLCKIIPFSQAMSIASSVLSLTVIAVDRFLAVMYPMKTFVTIQKTYGAIALIWFVGILANSPTLYAQKIMYLERNQRWTCVEIWEPAFIEGGYKAFTIVLFVFFLSISSTNHVNSVQLRHLQTLGKKSTGKSNFRKPAAIEQIPKESLENASCRRNSFCSVLVSSVHHPIYPVLWRGGLSLRCTKDFDIYGLFFGAC